MFKTPLLTVDCVILNDSSLVLIKRAHEPYKNWYALPGGFVDVGETLEEACCREVKEETGVEILPSDLKLIGAYSNPKRDTRHHVVSIAFLSHTPGVNLEAGDDALSVELVSDWEEIDIAFDHKNIIKDALLLR